jgi:hypothetical protein
MPESDAKNAKEWSAKQLAVIEWLAMPSDERTPLTQGALARQLGVHEVTLSKWTKLPGFQDEVHKLITASLGSDYHDIMAALKRQAKRGSFPHIKMCLELLGYYTERKQIDINVLREAAQEIAEREGLETEDVLAEVKAILAGVVR